ncbi:MAG: hypothetical protein K2I20_02825 [Clostridia bacterium]|nr:hypothetical protein [Clostridia bacterium]
MLNNYLKDKDVGFWFSASLVVFSLLTAVVYAVCYAGTDNINWVAFAFLIAAAVLGAALIALKLYVYVPYVLAALIFLSLLFFVYGIYYYVSVVMVGIDLDHFEPQFFVCTIMFVLATAASVANVFLRQIKKEVREDA